MTDSTAARVVHVLSDATARGCVILVAAAAVTLAMRRASSAARHAVWALAVAATLAVPPLTAVLPRRGIAVPTTARPAAAARQSAARPAPPVAAGDPDAGPGGYADPAGDRVAAGATPPSAAAAGRAGGVAAAACRWAALAWLAGVAGVAAGWASGAVLVWRMDRAATPVVDGPLHGLLADVRRQLGVRRRVRLLVAGPGSTPATWGVLRPGIALPAGAADWPAGRARAVLLHEMAHVRRWDCGVQHLTWLATAVYWFNPLVWLAVRQLRTERERACDDVVVTCGTAATAYAESLVALARTFNRGGLGVGLAMARRSGLRGRVRAILGGDVNRRGLGRRGRWTAGVAVVAVAVVVSTVHPPARSTARAAGPATAPAADGAPPPPARPALPATAPLAARPVRPGPDTAVSGFGLTVDSSFECGTPVTAQVLAADHISVRIDRTYQFDSWIFRLRGVAGRTVKIDVNMPAQTGTGSSRHSKTLTPMYGTVADLNDPAGYTTGPLDVPFAAGRQGVPIPDTREQAWHYMPDAVWVKTGGFTMTQAFTTDTVYIASRVLRPPGYNDRFMDGLATNPLAKVVDLGRTPAGWRLRALQVGDDAGTGAAAKPCVLMTAGEQAYQPDGMWACQGCIEFLVGDSDEAKSLRDRFVFLVMPNLNPDVTVNPNAFSGAYFFPPTMNATSIAAADWLQGRVLSGRRLDVLLDLHSFQSDELEHAQLWRLAEQSAATYALARTVDDAVRRRFATEQLVVSPPATNAFPMLTRFPGWVDRRLGAVSLAYTMNAQAPSGHLSLSQLKETGRLLALATAGVLSSREGTALLASVDRRRADHDAAWRGLPAAARAGNAIETEQAVSNALYLKRADHTNPNAATRPADFEYQFRLSPSQGRAADPDLSMYTRTSDRMELLARRLLAYAAAHQGRLPAGFGALAADLDGQDLRDLALDCLTPADEQRAGGVPDRPTADWIDQHASYLFPAAGADLTRLTDARRRRSANVPAATAMFHTRLDQPFYRPAEDDDEVFVITLDGQRQVLTAEAAKTLIEKSGPALTAAGAAGP